MILAVTGFYTADQIATIAGTVTAILAAIFIPLFRKGMKEWHENLNDTIDERVTPHFVEIMQEVMNIQTEVQGLKERLVNHESRISYIEGWKKGKEGG